MKEALIIFVILLLLLTIISVFGGSIRYTPTPQTSAIVQAWGGPAPFPQQVERFYDAVAAVSDQDKKKAAAPSAPVPLESDFASPTSMGVIDEVKGSAPAPAPIESFGNQFASF